MLSILSLVVGIITVVYSLNLNKKTNNSSTFSSSCNCDLIKTEIKNLKKLINQIDKKTNQNVSSSKNNPVNSDIADLTNRIEVIEKGISDNPEKTLSLLNMNNDISQLEKSDESIREINKTEIESLKNEMENQNSWISGLLITIFGLVLSFAVPNLLANIKENKVFERAESVSWVCRKCGYVHVGNKALSKCPSCEHPLAYFELKKENY